MESESVRCRPEFSIYKYSFDMQSHLFWMKLLNETLQSITSVISFKVGMFFKSNQWNRIITSTLTDRGSIKYLIENFQLQNVEGEEQRKY